MKEIYNQSKKLNLPIILNETKEVLETLVLEQKPKLILEIGSAIGYSSAVMLNCSKKSKLITIEKEIDRAEICKKNLAMVAENRATVVNGDAMEFLKSYKGEKFDFVFIDGPKGQYLNYINLLMPMLEHNAIIVCDNVYFHGYVNSQNDPPKSIKTMIKNLRAFNEFMLNSSNFETQILNKGDGILIAKYVK